MLSSKTWMVWHIRYSTSIGKLGLNVAVSGQVGSDKFVAYVDRSATVCRNNQWVFLPVPRLENASLYGWTNRVAAEPRTVSAWRRYIPNTIALQFG